MKVAIICGSAGDTHCGVGDYSFELAQHLALDAEVDLYFERHHGPATPPFAQLNTLKLHPLGGFSLFSVKSLAARLSHGEYDIVHIQYPSKGYGTAVGPGFLPQNLTGMQSRSRIVLTLHEWSTSHALRRMVMDQMLPGIDALVVSTEGEMDALQDKLKTRPIFVLPVGNVLASRPELEAVWLQAEGKPVPQLPAPAGPAGRQAYSLFHYGLPTKGKGFDRLLGALKLVRDAGITAVLKIGGEFVPGEQQTESLLRQITELNLADAVDKLGHIPTTELAQAAEKCWAGIFPFDEGFSSKRSSLATISLLDLPLIVGSGSREDHPYYAPAQNTAAELAVLITELFRGRLEQEWVAQVNRQREYAQRFSFAHLAAQHLDIYSRLRKVDV